MPIAYTFLAAPGVHLVSYQGIVTNADFLESYKAAARDPRYRPGMVEISDFRHAEAMDIEFSAMQELAAWVAGREDLVGTTLRCGVLLGNDVQVGLSRLYEAVAATQTAETIRRFRDLPTLLAWLPVDPVHTAEIDAALTALARSEEEPTASSGQP